MAHTCRDAHAQSLPRDMQVKTLMFCGDSQVVIQTQHKQKYMHARLAA
jgi:hypothetical protein